MSRNNGNGKRASAPSRSEKKKKPRSNRDLILFGLFILVILVLATRLVYLQVYKADEYSAAAQQQRTSDVTLSARRGTIYDRNGNVLATSIDATTVYANPAEISDPDAVAEQIASILGGEASDYIESLEKEGTSFVYVARKADVDAAAELENLGIDGIYFLDDSKRVYPYGDTAGQIIGITGVDGEGLTGLEYEYNDVLSGTDGELLVECGQDGTPVIDGVTKEIAAQDGEDVVISIDLEIQEYAEEQLTAAVEEWSADSGSVVVMDPTTGEIYATASTPYLDPNDYTGDDSDRLKLKTVSDAYEPGSTLKCITAAAAIEEGVMETDTPTLDVPASLEVDSHTITDSHDRSGTEVMSLREILEQSSNIGAALVEREVGDETLYKYLEAFGLTEDSGVDYPGVATGLLADSDTWSSTAAANIAFGQGVSVSALQLSRAISTIANGGIMTTPHFLIDRPGSSDEITWDSERVISTATANDVTDMLESVITDGTGSEAVVDGYTVAGKTGTAQKASESGGYISGEYVTSFVGYLSNVDADDSGLLVLVVIDNPDTAAGGGVVAAPVFSDIMSFAANRLKITPDAVDE